jgi:hypothetical protein
MVSARIARGVLEQQRAAFYEALRAGVIVVETSITGIDFLLRLLLATVHTLGHIEIFVAAIFDRFTYVRTIYNLFYIIGAGIKACCRCYDHSGPKK